MNYHKCDDHQHKQDFCHAEEDCINHEIPHPKEKCHESGYSEMCLDMSKMKCKTERECVKTYKCYYKLYKICQYRMYKVCPCCGHEFDYHHHRGICPKCNINM